MNAAAPPAAHARLTYAGLAALVAVLWFALLPVRPLFNPDEGRYAEIPREMLQSGDWLIPHLNGLAYIEKPPLQYWATALALQIFGQGEFGARCYTALCALATLCIVWLTARRLWGCAAGWRASAVLSGMTLFVILGQLLTLDMSLTFYMTLALAGFLWAQQVPRARSGRGAMLVAWAATALGVLTKGLVAVAIPAAVLVLYTLYARDPSPWRRLYGSRGLPLFLVITVPWHWLAARRMPGFLQFFFVHEHLARYLTPSADREAPWWFFAVVFSVGSLPWTSAALRVVVTSGRRGTRSGQFEPITFLWLWVVFIGVFFSLSDSKLIPYILPAMPAVALLIAALPAATLSRELLVSAVGTMLAATGLALTGILGPRFIAASPRSEYFVLLARPLAEAAALVAACGAFVLLRRRHDSTAAAVVLGVGWCLAGMWLMRAASLVAPVYSGIVLARAADPIPRDMPLYSVGTYDQTLPFYWHRTLELVAYRGELDFGLRQDPSAEIPSLEEFAERWRAVPNAYAVMERSMFDDLEGRGLPMREIARDVHRVLVSRR